MSIGSLMAPSLPKSTTMASSGRAPLGWSLPRHVCVYLPHFRYRHMVSLLLLLFSPFGFSLIRTALGVWPQDGNVWAAVMDERRCHPLIRNKGALIVESNRQLPIQRRPELVHGLQNLLARLLSGRGLINIP